MVKLGFRLLPAGSRPENDATGAEPTSGESRAGVYFGSPIRERAIFAEDMPVSGRRILPFSWRGEEFRRFIRLEFPDLELDF